ncbi:MAG: di-trans,poly-cis-decaprenylcistransferase [Phycisphaeraceae bacterium]|nr:di-trans,poly-cis-decaprenylcistransferase [Phycisphaeraceae bacterium]
MSVTPLSTPSDPVRPEAAFLSDPAVLARVAEMRTRYGKADPLNRLPDVDPRRIPRHVAVIMDGNGRWARQRGFPRIFGHRNGARALRETVEEAGRLGVEAMTFYSFSLENWRRPAEEVEALMLLCIAYCEGEREALVRDDIRFRWIGRRAGLPAPVLAALDSVVEATKQCGGPTLCVAVNYGSRAELADAARAIASEIRAGTLRPEDIDEDSIAARLYAPDLPDPDLLIRTAGEMRVSNYLLWQISYAELYVTETLWPDFDSACLHAAIRDFAGRTRRFGGLDLADAEPRDSGAGRA